MEKHWCIKVNDENRNILDEWRKKQKNYRDDLSTYGWVTSSPRDDNSYMDWDDKGCSNAKKEGHIEIAYEELLEITGEKKEELHYSIFN